MFKKNQLVIHINYGIGKYIKLCTVEINGFITEYLVIMYANNAKLYVPVTSIHLITKYYNMNNTNVSLHTLNNNNWKEEKNKTIRKIFKIAIQLKKIYLTRINKKGFSFQININEYKKFCKNFPFKTTVDQKNTINSVIKNMHKSIPMDHLVCGDVGFGKTEIAMRATFIALQNYKQVAILVPTIILAQQHFNNFKQRFLEYSYKIKIISSFLKKKKKLKYLKELKNGDINVIIGTHSILSKNLEWNDLGLLIIDEEHKFGVIHKEEIKKKYNNIDILTLTATPIPRTFYMSFLELKDLSIISTPPKNRIDIKTFIKNYDINIIKKIILKEILTEGKVYYIFNNIKNIQKKAVFLSKLIPEAKIKIAHGKMDSKCLHKIINDFSKNYFNILLSTTIIESGIDISNVNLIIIENAENFGLTQLHQLRGRVGRSNMQAYAWLFVSDIKKISSIAKKRLKAITTYSNLGSGYFLSRRDSEIRGVGELLGTNQSGNIKKIGISLYKKILFNTIKIIKENKIPCIDDILCENIDIKVNITTRFSRKYIENENVRLYYYTKIASAKSINSINLIQIELLKKFGKLPKASNNLLYFFKIRILSIILKIKKIRFEKKTGYIKFFKNHCIDIEKLLKIVLKNPETWKISKNILFFEKSFEHENIQLAWLFNQLIKISKIYT